MPKTPKPTAPTRPIDRHIRVIRGQRVMLDSDLAALYGVETRALTQAVRRNTDRFPSSFMFQLSSEEAANMRSQIVTASKRNIRYQPLAFTEHGVVMAFLGVAQLTCDSGEHFGRRNFYSFCVSSLPPTRTY